MTGKRGRPSAGDKAERHERIVDLVVAILASEGYDSVTFDRIAADAHVAKRTLYGEYGDRLGLVRAAVRRQHAYADGAWQSANGVRAASVAVVSHLLADEAVAVHRALIGAGGADAALAAEFYDEGPGRAQRFLSEHLPADAVVPADLLFAALLGEPHRRRLLGLDPAPSTELVAAHVDRTLKVLGL
ncbi:TetR/AcrR family transcriptional regulator [Microbacterium sp. NPDC008134]|uniref:TetR/AcrR family transcriptional regulator n=1 Tax=Microbacterium sp. NPDC008134 TaxID=3364183 RepID=UPI0036EC90F5